MNAEQALRRAVAVADEAREEWDKSPTGMRAGKILIALSGHAPGYRADIDEIHAALICASKERDRYKSALTELCDFIDRASEHELVRAHRYAAYLDARAALLPS